MVKIPSAQDLGLAPSATPQSSLGPQQISVPDLSIGSQQLSALGRGLSSMFKDAVQLRTTLQGIEDERILMENESSLADIRRDALYGEGGLMSQKLGDAVGASERAAAMIPDWKDQLQYEGLSEAGLDAMDAYMNREEDSLLDAVARHEMSERQAYRKAMLKANEDRIAEEAKYYYANGDKLLEMEAGIVANHEARLPENATKGERAAMEVEAQAAVEAMYENVMMRAVAEGGDKQARAILSSLTERGMFSDGAGDDIRRIVAEGELEGAVQQWANDLWEGEDMNLGDALRQVDDMDITGEAKEDLRAELNRRYTAAKNEDEQLIYDITHTSRQLALKGQLGDMDRELFLKLPANVREELRNIDAGMAATTNPTVSNMLYEMGDTLGDHDLSQYMGQLSTDDYETLLDRQQKINARVEVTNRATLDPTLQNYFRTNGTHDKLSGALRTMVTEWADQQDKYPDAYAIRAKLVEYNSTLAETKGWFGTGGDTVQELVTAFETDLNAEQLRTSTAIGTDLRDQSVTVLSIKGVPNTFDNFMAAATLLSQGTPESDITKDMIIYVSGAD